MIGKMGFRLMIGDEFLPVSICDESYLKEYPESDDTLALTTEMDAKKVLDAATLAVYNTYGSSHLFGHVQIIFGNWVWCKHGCNKDEVDGDVIIPSGEEMNLLTNEYFMNFIKEHYDEKDNIFKAH